MFHRSRLMIIAVLACLGIVPTLAAPARSQHAVGVAQIEYTTPTDHRPMWLAVFYPAAPNDPSATQFHVPFTINLRLYADAPFIDDGAKHPLIMLSQNRQNEMDAAKTEEILQRLEDLQSTVEELRRSKP